MRDQRSGEGKKSGYPMSRIEMVSSGDFNQFFAAGKFVGQEMEQIEAADDKADEQPGDGNTEKNAEDKKQLVRSKTGFNRNGSALEQVEA